MSLVIRQPFISESKGKVNILNRLAPNDDLGGLRKKVAMFKVALLDQCQIVQFIQNINQENGPVSTSL